jgi:hypothetical protein
MTFGWEPGDWGSDEATSKSIVDEAFDLGIRVHGRGGIGRPGYAARPAVDRMID